MPTQVTMRMSYRSAKKIHTEFNTRDSHVCLEVTDAVWDQGDTDTIAVIMEALLESGGDSRKFWNQAYNGIEALTNRTLNGVDVDCPDEILSISDIAKTELEAFDYPDGMANYLSVSHWAELWSETSMLPLGTARRMRPRLPGAARPRV